MTDATINQFEPDVVFPPGETLLETLQATGMTQAELARRMGCPLTTLSEMIQGRVAITPQTALQLERILGVPAGFWQNLERSYRDHLARQQQDKVSTSRIEFLKPIPLREVKP